MRLSLAITPPPSDPLIGHARGMLSVEGASTVGSLRARAPLDAEGSSRNAHAGERLRH